ncbi:Cytochrome c oxidase assembly protein cox15 [Kappamyces sp. JEL0680]|nr:Cytochrome c oxidase assembly protein cox15 [Kappamyces sp. JEL0680]
MAGDPNLSRETQSSQPNASGSGPRVSRPVVGWWYLFSGSLVFGIVILGGLTRLTESGLSIVEWNLIKGMKPPTSDQEWHDEFEKYKQFPEYKLLNHNITIEEFKKIFYMEWAHRMWGRAIGLVFVIPGLYFATKGYMTRAIRSRSLAVAAMIGTQGVLGWYMVKSGLDHEIVEKKQVPRVDHFWLSAHLGSAFLIYCAMVFTGLEILKQNRFATNPSLKSLQISHPLFKRYAHVVLGLVFLTAISGAWVAGLDAGLIYNEFPYMGEGFVPSDMWAYSTPSPTRPEVMPWWENLAKNPAAVQFNHRLLATTTFTAVSLLWVMSRRVPLSSISRMATNTLLGVACIQVSLGIATLLYLVPVPLAAAHQAGSLSLLTVAVWLAHTLKRIK